MTIHRYGTTEVETAATCQEELPFLVNIAANQLDELQKLVYADWLEDRGDPRGSFLREFVKRANVAHAPLPVGDEFPLPWRQIVGIQSQQRLREYLLHGYISGGPPSLEADLMRGLKPMLYMLVTPAEDADFLPGATKFGGRPDLSPGSDWPADSYPDGILAGVFCAQIRFSDLRDTVAGQDLPGQGLLSFFADELKIPCRFQAETGPFHRADPPAPRMERYADEFYPLPSGAVRFIEGADFDIRFFELMERYKDVWPEADFRANWSSFESLYRDLMPPAISWCHQFLGNGREFNTYPPPDRAPGFCRVASFDAPFETLDWGDSNHPIYYISKADLAAGRFENTRAYVG